MATGPKRIITLEAFETLIAQIPKDQPMASLSKLLEDNGYSPILSNIDFAILGLTIDHPSGAGESGFSWTRIVKKCGLFGNNV